MRVGTVGAEHNRAAEQGLSGADDRANVAGIGNPMQVNAGWPYRSGPDLRPNGDHPRARAKRRDLRQQLRLDFLAADLATGEAEQDAGLGASGQPRLDQVLALGREQSLALALLALAQLADQFQLLVVGAGNHPVLVRVGRIFSWNGATSGQIKNGP